MTMIIIVFSKSIAEIRSVVVVPRLRRPPVTQINGAPQKKVQKTMLPKIVSVGGGLVLVRQRLSIDSMHKFYGMGTSLKAVHPSRVKTNKE